MIRNIVFDMGGVLIDFNPEFFMDREGIIEEEDRKIIRKELFRSVEWVMMDLGQLSEDEVEPRVNSRVPERLRSHVSHLLKHWSDDRKMIDGMEDLVRRLKEAGYGIYLLSNASVDQPNYWKKLPVSRHFDGTLVSAFVKQVKPMHEIYRTFTRQFDLKPEECVFIDDVPMNVACAILNGWEGIVFYGDARELQVKLAALGVRI